MAAQLNLLSGGAAQGLVARLQDRFQAESGLPVAGSFGAVGAMRDKLLAGDPCDVVILTQALIEQLERDGHVVNGSATPLGIVKTGVAVKAGDPAPQVSTAAQLKSALLAANGIYFPDPVKATAGIHFMKVMKSLQVDAPQAARLRAFPNGATAMREMAQSPESRLIGCTQVTEILFTPGVQLVGLLPAEFELATVYTAGVCARSQDMAAARKFIAMLSDAQAAQLRTQCGFEVA